MEMGSGIRALRTFEERCTVGGLKESGGATVELYRVRGVECGEPHCYCYRWGSELNGKKKPSANERLAQH